MNASEPLLAVDQLRVMFNTTEGQISAVNGISLAVQAGQNLAVVGESGSGKSQLFLAMMGLLARNGTATGQVKFQGKDLLGLSPKQLNRYRGSRIAMIFQDPMTALNPYLRIGRQLTEVLQVHQGIGLRQATAMATEMLDQMRIRQASQRMKQYPHQLSGGMRQRVMIAMALLCHPQLLIADEPTTALDVTVQAEIMALLRDIHESSLILITHDLPLVSGLCQRVMVMYAGRVMESTDTDTLFSGARHPYTQGLLAAIPSMTASQKRLQTIPGNPPDPGQVGEGCAFAPRCNHAMPICQTNSPTLRLVGDAHWLACHLETA